MTVAPGPSLGNPVKGAASHTSARYGLSRGEPGGRLGGWSPWDPAIGAESLMTRLPAPDTGSPAPRAGAVPPGPPGRLRLFLSKPPFGAQPGGAPSAPRSVFRADLGGGHSRAAAARAWVFPWPPPSGSLRARWQPQTSLVPHPHPHGPQCVMSTRYRCEEGRAVRGALPPTPARIWPYTVGRMAHPQGQDFSFKCGDTLTVLATQTLLRTFSMRCSLTNITLLGRDL